MNSRSSGFTVRPADPADAPTLGAMRAELFSELGRLSASGWPAFERAASEAVADALGRGVCCAWIAETSSGQPIGCASMLLSPKLPSPELSAVREGYLLNVYTVPAWRRRGISTALLAAAVAKGRELGLGRIRLHATADGERLYASAGFKKRYDEMELGLEP